MSATPVIPPPPQVPADDVTPDLGPVSRGSGSGMDRFRSFLNNASGGGIPAIQERLQADYAKRQHDAQMYHDLAKTHVGLLTHANASVGPDAPYGINQQTGQPATPQDIQQWHNNYDTAWGAYQKLLPKDAKPIAQKMSDVVEHVIGRKGKSGAPAGQSSAPAIPPPPSSAGDATGASVGPVTTPPSTSGAGAAGSMSTATEVPPSMQPGMLGLGETQRMTGTQNAAQAESAKTQAELAGQIKAREDLLKRDPTLADDPLRMSMMLGHPLYGMVSKTVGAGGGLAKDLRAEGYKVPDSIPDGQWTNVKQLGGGQITFVPGAPPSGQYAVTDNGVVPRVGIGTTKSGSSAYNADTGVTTNTSTTRKVVGGTSQTGRPAAIPAPPGGGGGQTRSGGASKGGRLASMADDWQNSGVIPSAKDKPQVEAYMRTQGTTPPAVLTGPAQTLIMKTKPVQDQVDRLLGDIDRLKLGDNNTRGYLFLPRLNYATGGASDEGSLGHDIAGLSLGSVVEAASALQGSSRSIQALHIAMQHTPNAWIDSPKLIKEKLQTIKDRLQDVVDDANKYGRKNQAAAGTGNAAARPGSIPPPPRGAPRTAEEYLQSLHAQ